MLSGYQPTDLRNAKTGWFILGQFLYYQSEKHTLLSGMYYRIFEQIVRIKGVFRK